MAKILYNTGIPMLPAKWATMLSVLLDSIGIHTITITSTFRSIESNAAAMYGNIKKVGIKNSMDVYNAEMRQVIQVYADMIAKGSNQADTINAMAQKTRELTVPVHSRPQSDKFCVFDVPPSAIPDNLRSAFEKLMEKHASKFINPFKQKGDTVYHIELGDSPKPIASTFVTGIIVVGLMFYFFMRKAS
jgi:hypothetical protein